MSFSKSNEICYFCGDPKTGKEHVPAKVFFPNAKNSRTQTNQRNNLITVPSCDEHNTGKSDLDEYLFAVISMNCLVNSDGQHIGSTKTLRSLQRNNKSFRDYIGSHQSVLLKDMSTGEFSRSIAFEVDDNKLQIACDYISKAVYFSHYKKRFIGKTEAKAEFLVFSGKDVGAINNELEAIRIKIKLYFKNIEKFGQNQEIFYYQIIEEEGNNEILLRLCFYEKAYINIFMSSKI